MEKQKVTSILLTAEEAQVVLRALASHMDCTDPVADADRNHMVPLCRRLHSAQWEEL